MANLRSKAAPPATFATEDAAERFECQAHEPYPQALGPWWLEALSWCDRRRRHRLSDLSMRSQKRVNLFRSVYRMLSLRTGGHSAKVLSKLFRSSDCSGGELLPQLLDLRAIHERGIGGDGRDQFGGRLMHIVDGGADDR
jgi:hypothetical protein